MTKPKDEESELGPGDEPNIKQVAVRMSLRLYEVLLEEADEEYLMLSEHVRGILREHIAQEDCDECGESVPGDAAYCPYCGEEFAEEDEDEEPEKED